MHKDEWLKIGIIGLLCLSGINLLAQDMVEQDTANLFESTGKEFILPDNPSSPGLKITSSEEIHIFIQAVTNTVSFNIEPVSNSPAITSTITVEGLKGFFPGLADGLYRYQDGYFQEKFSINNDGIYSYTQDISQAHHTYILSYMSTIYLSGSPGEVISLFGRFGALITEPIVVQSDGIVIDGSNSVIEGPGSGYGIYLYGRSNVTVRNCTIRSFNSGIYIAAASHHNTFLRNSISNNYFGVVNQTARADVVYENTINANTFGIYCIPWVTKQPFPWLYGSDIIVYHNNIYNNTSYNFYVSAHPMTAPWELSAYISDRGRNEGNFWGHTSAPGFYIYGINTPPDSNDATVKDSYPYLVENGWPPYGDYDPGEVRDTTAPSGSIVINSATAPGPTQTTNQTVTLYLSASDPSPTYEPLSMRFSNDNVTWSSWLPYATTYTWVLSAGDGTKTVYARFRNRVGLESSIVSDTIIYSTDTTPPDILGYGPTGLITSHQPNIYASYSDNSSGIDVNSVRIVLDGIERTPVNRTNSYVDYMPPILSYGEHNVSVYVKDMVGNERAFPWKFTVINPPPDMPVLQAPSDGIWLNNNTPNFTAQVSDPGGETVRARFIVEYSTGGVIYPESQGFPPADLPRLET